MPELERPPLSSLLAGIIPPSFGMVYGSVSPVVGMGVKDEPAKGIMMNWMGQNSPNLIIKQQRSDNPVTA